MNEVLPTLPVAKVSGSTEQRIVVDFSRFKQPVSGRWEKVLLGLWYLSLAWTQFRHDLLRQPNKLWTMSWSDLFTRLIYLPIGRGTPRLVTGGPYEHLTIFDISRDAQSSYEEKENIFQLKTSKIINCASNNYAGFSRLEGGAEALIKHTITSLPFAPGPPELEETLKAELTKYMGFDACDFMPSGFSSNMLAFRTIRQYARSCGRSCIFLCDRECHNSLFSGAYTNSRENAATYKFNHNDLTDLELQLQVLKQQQPNALVCVVVEGIYSLEGASAPLPAIIALKKLYNFCLLVDEAHSFLSLGNSGRGGFEHWQDLGYDCPISECDIMTCMFSKSAGCTGGMVLARGDYAPQLKISGDEVQSRGAERLSTAILIRLLNIFRKPALIQQRVRMVREKGLYAARILKEAGFQILSFPGSPIICFSVGSLRQLAHFQTEVQRRGLAVAFAGPPATPLWGCRCRMSIFATLPWTDLHAALMVLVETGVNQKLTGIKAVTEQKIPLDISGTDVENMYASVDEDLTNMVDSLAKLHPRPVNIGSQGPVIDSARAALERYGIGPCSARWFYGSFDVYVSLEQRLAQMYPSLVAHSGQCRAMVCGDADVTIGSSFAARSAVSYYQKSTHFTLIPHSAPHFINEALGVARTSKSRPLVYYNSVADIPQLLQQHVTRKDRTVVSIYLDVVDRCGMPIDIIPVLSAISRLPTARLQKICLFLDDRNGLNKLGPRRLGYLDHLESIHGANVFSANLKKAASKVEIIVAGSWYNSFGHQGGYVVGASTVVESLTWNSRAYFFSTPPMPLQTVMSNKALQLLQEKVI